MAGGRAILVGVVALVAAGAGGAAWLASAGGVKSAAVVAPTTASAPAPPPESVPADAVLATLPLVTATGRILLTTRACRLGLLDLATRRVVDPRPNIATCTARFGGRTGTVALVEPKERTSTTTLTRLAGAPAADRAIRLPGLLEDLAISPDGDVAACAGGGLGDAGRTTIVVSLDASGSSRQVPGCHPAWWGGRLTWIDRHSHLVAGDVVIPLGRHTYPETIGSSADGQMLAVLSVGGEGGAVVSVLRAGTSDVPIRRLVLHDPPALSSPTIRIAPDGAVLALRGDGGQWSLYRTDGAVPPASDVAGIPIADVAFAPDSRFVATIAGGRLVFLDPETLGPVAQLPFAARTIDWAP